jgi:anti-sigma factor RsiW
MNDPAYNKLREISWRRKLTAAESAELHALLAEHPEAQADWELDSALTESLGHLPDAPVSTNFTARVLQEVRGQSAPVRRSGWKWSWNSFLPRAAVATIALGLGLAYYGQHRTAQRTEFARKVAEVSGVAAVPEPAVMQDFEVISRLSEPDQNLLALLQ